jgi:ComF family protein
MVRDYGTNAEICQPGDNMKVYKWSGQLLDSLFPPACRLCGARTGAGPALCAGCRHDLPRLIHGCRQCARPLPGDAPQRCGHCQRQPPPFDHTTALFHYQPPLDFLLKRLKFARDPGMGPLLAALLARELRRRTAPLPGLLVPMPLHPTRLRERGYNQAVEIARPLGKALGIPLDHGLCRRTRRTEAQSLLGTTARRLNVRNAFVATGTAATAHVAIVDDVMTTGCTVSELARVLKRAGVGKVEVWVIARAVRHGY